MYIDDFQIITKPLMNKEEYSKYLDHPLWIKKRDDVIYQSNSECSKCSSKHDLNVHHKSYETGKMPWQYPMENFEVLCGSCHAKEHGKEYKFKRCLECEKQISPQYTLCYRCHMNSLQKEKEENIQLQKKLDDLHTETKSKPKPSIIMPVSTIVTLIVITMILVTNSKESDTTYEQDIQELSGRKGSSVIVPIQADDKPNPPQTTDNNQTTAQTKKKLGSSDVVENPENFIGTDVSFTARVSQITSSQTGNIYLNIGDEFPNHKIHLVIFQKQAGLFKDIKSYEGQDVKVTGKVTLFKGKPQIVITSEKQLSKGKVDQSKSIVNTPNKFIDKDVTFTALVAQINHSKNGNIYLNLGERYPNHKIHLVIFKKDIALFKDVKSFEGKYVKITGKVTVFKDKPQIIINSKKQLSL